MALKALCRLGSWNQSEGKIKCKIWYLISRTMSDPICIRRNIHDRSIRAFAVKPRAFGAPLSGFGA
jgi:hypothetical protein